MSHALADMAAQIRSYRTTEGLTLQELASRSGLAASTIHKVESQQMVPTVSVLLKIARGLDRRPEELIRDSTSPMPPAAEPDATGAGDSPPAAGQTHTAIWRLELTPATPLTRLPLEPSQRVIVWVEGGTVDLEATARSHRLATGDCLQVEGDRWLRATPATPMHARSRARPPLRALR